VTPRRLAHGYTNETWASAGSVFKRYLGPDADARMQRELTAIGAVRGAVPTARVLAVHPAQHTVEFGRVQGRPGQELVARGLAGPVLRAAGRVLAALHSLPDVHMTHGDYGPQNLLLDAAGEAVLLVADWEFSTRERRPVVDLAWAEWIVRMHHPHEAASVDALYEGYGAELPWDERQRVMLERCEVLRLRCVAAGDVAAARTWAARALTTSSWSG
jgi:tRNA A-37 threonylcarbamoyl transferase component Bud32